MPLSYDYPILIQWPIITFLDPGAILYSDPFTLDKPPIQLRLKFELGSKYSSVYLIVDDLGSLKSLKLEFEFWLERAWDEEKVGNEMGWFS
jgi:hypothetical protein